MKLSLLCLGLSHSAAQAATIEVDTHLDGNVAGCTLRKAIASFSEFLVNEGCANISSEPFGTNDRIVFSDSLNTNSTIELSEGPLSFSGLGSLARVVNLSRSFQNHSDSSDFDNGLSIDASNIEGGITVDASRQSRVFSVSSANLRIINMTFTGGRIFDRRTGAGIKIDNSNVELHSVTITGNEDASSEVNQGGGLSIFNKSTVGLVNSTISDNSADGVGGGIILRGSSLNIIDSLITGNSASSTGGGLMVITGRSNPASINITNSAISFNSARDGGGISAFRYFSTGSVGTSVFNIKNSDLSNNTATRDGGGLLINEGQHSIRLEDSTLSQNAALDNGGAIAMIQSVPDPGSEESINMELVRSTITNNSANVDGGGIMVVQATLKSNNSTISGNIARDDAGGILAMQNANVVLDSVTIFNNRASSRGAGVGSFFNAKVSIKNSILAASTGLDCFVDSSASVVELDQATIVEDGSCGATRFGDPGLLPLADNGGRTLTHALSEDSIARNSSLGSCLAFDQRRKRRDFSDGACDVGAFEYVVEQDSSFFVVPLNNGKAVIFQL